MRRFATGYTASEGYADTLLSVDPDTTKQAWAYFERDTSYVYTMRRCGFWRFGEGVRLTAGHLVIEGQVIDQRTAEKKAQDIADLSLHAGMMIGRCDVPWVTVVKPEEWKGQNSKPNHHRRLLETLTENEWIAFLAVARYTPADWRAYVYEACRRKSLAGGKVSGYSREGTEILDAIGIGKQFLGLINTSGAAVGGPVNTSGAAVSAQCGSNNTP